MTPAYPQWPGFPLRFATNPGEPVVPSLPPALEARQAFGEAPDHHSQLEELLGHVRRCEGWARLDDRIDLSLRLDGDA